MAVFSKKVTIKDVAKKANTSISTVSYAINDSPKVAKETKERILQIVKELGYKPNLTARNLKIARTRTIGIFFSDLSGPIFSSIVEEVETEVRRWGYELIVCSTKTGKNSTAYKYLNQGYIDGAIILSHELSDSFLLKIASQKTPLILLGRELEHPYIKAMVIDNEVGAYEATKYLLERGNPVYYLAGAPSYDNSKRYEGYKKALQDYQKEPNFLCIDGDFTEVSGYQGIKKILQSQRPPFSVFAANDEMGIGVLTYLKEIDFDLRQINLIGFDDIRLSSLVTPKLSSVSYIKEKRAREGAKQLLEFIERGKAFKSGVTKMTTKLVIRET